MKRSDITYLIYFILVITSCSNLDEEETEDYFNMDFEAMAKHYVPLDTIPLSDSINYFNYDVNIDRIKENKITAAQFPNLSVYMLDSLGNVLQKITQAGNAPGMLGRAQLASTLIDEYGNIFVLTLGNTYRLFMFDKNYNLTKTLNLFKIIEEVTVPPVKDVFKVININNKKIKVVISVLSAVYGMQSVDFFENASGIVEFTIDLERLEVVDYAKHLPYRNIPDVKVALKDKSIWWRTSNPLLEIHDDKYYLSYPFTSKVFVYDNNYKLLKNVDINILSNLINYKYIESMGKTAIDFYDRVISARRLKYENINVNHIDIKDNYLLIQFPEVLKENSYSLPTKSEIGVSVGRATKVHLNAIIKNLETGEEKLITLPPDFFRIDIIDWDTFYGFHISDEKEFTALIKFRYE